MVLGFSGSLDLGFYECTFLFMSPGRDFLSACLRIHYLYYNWILLRVCGLSYGTVEL